MTTDLNRPLPGVLNNMLRRAERQRLNSQRRVIPATGDHAAAVHDEQVRHIVSLVILVHHRCLRVVPHPAGAAVVRASAGVADGRRPYFFRSGGLQYLYGLLPEELHALEVVGMAR